MAFSKKSRGNGLSSKAIGLIKEYCLSNGINAIRVDTQEENKVMQHILAREGFVYCGVIQFGGGPKLAYEWDG
jgi:RimJ/RimL family protein N-acetyltransferase